MVTTHKVYKGIPMPKIKRSRSQSSQPRARKYDIGAMDVGDCHLIPGRDASAVGAYISRIARSEPGRFSLRSVELEPVGEDGWKIVDEPTDFSTPGVGVWRVQ